MYNAKESWKYTVCLLLEGNTYPIKEELKADGFKYDGQGKCWRKFFLESELNYVRRLAEAFETTDGVIASVRF